MIRLRYLLLFSASVTAMAALTLVLLSWNLVGILGLPVSARLYLLAIALMQVIFTIWYSKGARELKFARFGAMARMFLAPGFAACAIYQTSGVHGAEGQPWLWRGLIVYAAFEFLIGSILLLATAKLAGPTIETKPMRAPHINRLLFAIYMLLLSGWIFFLPESFIDFFHLPQPAVVSESHLQQGLLSIFSLLLVQLVIFNLIAVRHRIEVLIEAGMRGGLITCVAVALLVLFRVAHPLVLLLPAVDLVSVAVIALGKVRQR